MAQPTNHQVPTIFYHPVYPGSQHSQYIPFDPKSPPIFPDTNQAGFIDLSAYNAHTPQSISSQNEYITAEMSRQLSADSARSPSGYRESEYSGVYEAATSSSPPLQETPNTSVGSLEDADEEQKRNKFLERNRVAASKCRQKKKQWVTEMENHSSMLQGQNQILQATLHDLEAEVGNMKSALMEHAGCKDSNIDTWLQMEARRVVAKGSTPMYPRGHPGHPQIPPMHAGVPVNSMPPYSLPHHPAIAPQMIPGTLPPQPMGTIPPIAIHYPGGSATTAPLCDPAGISITVPQHQMIDVTTGGPAFTTATPTAMSMAEIPMTMAPAMSMDMPVSSVPVPVSIPASGSPFGVTMGMDACVMPIGTTVGVDMHGAPVTTMTIEMPPVMLPQFQP